MGNYRLVRAKEITQEFGITRSMLIAWEKQGKLKVYHTPGGGRYSQRRYLVSEVLEVAGIVRDAI